MSLNLDHNQQAQESIFCKETTRVANTFFIFSNSTVIQIIFQDFLWQQDFFDSCKTLNQNWNSLCLVITGANLCAFKEDPYKKLQIDIDLENYHPF